MMGSQPNQAQSPRDVAAPMSMMDFLDPSTLTALLSPGILEGSNPRQHSNQAGTSGTQPSEVSPGRSRGSGNDFAHSAGSVGGKAVKHGRTHSRGGEADKQGALPPALARDVRTGPEGMGDYPGQGMPTRQDGTGMTEYFDFDLGEYSSNMDGASIDGPSRGGSQPLMNNNEDQGTQPSQHSHHSSTSASHLSRPSNSQVPPSASNPHFGNPVHHEQRPDWFLSGESMRQSAAGHANESAELDRLGQDLQRQVRC